MTCYHSKPAWRTTNPNENGRHPIHFQFQDRTPDYFIDCGRCEGCRKRQREDWAIRIYHESKTWARNSFLTLTYDQEHCPEKINREDPRAFIRKLKRESNRDIRYYLVGEYGEKTRRPHYHAIIFNEDFLGGSYSINDKLHGNPFLDQFWPHGIVAAAEFTYATAMYVSGYTSKKINDKDTFALQSRNPPIGKNWVRANHDNIRRNENVVIEGSPKPIPKVYLNWVEGTESFAHIKENLAAKIRPLNDQKLRNRKRHQQAKNTLRNESI